MIGRRGSEPPPPSTAAPSAPPIETVADRPRRVTQIFGVGGMGKSLYLKGVIRGRIRSGGRVVVIDPNGQFGSYGYRVSVSRAIEALRVAGNRPFALVLEPGFREDISDVFEAAFRAGSLLLAVDDCADLAGRLRLDPNLLRLVQTGRNRLVDVAFTCHSPTDLDPRIRLQFTSAICFRQQLPDAATRFADEYAHRPDLVDVLKALPKFHYVRATMDGELTRGVVPDPARNGEP